MIQFDNVSFAYGRRSLLREVSFEVSAGEYIAVIGPNGGGKTTLLKLIMGLLAPISGAVKVFGQKPQKVRTKMGWVPQSFQFDPAFPISVKEVVLGGTLAKAPRFFGYTSQNRRAADKALERVGLEKYALAPFSSLSGGLAQRALIARAIASEPKLLLLDEPTSGVDIRAESEIYDLLDSLKGEITLIIVTHDLGVAVERVQRVFCVQGGVVAISPEQVCEHFALGLYHTPLQQAQKEDAS